MDKHITLLKKSLDYAAEHETFNKGNIIKNAKPVCVYGLGTFFREAFKSKHIKGRYHVNLLSDNDSSKWGKIIEGYHVFRPKNFLMMSEEPKRLLY